MKNIVVVAAMLIVALAGAGCKQQEQKQQVNYTPAAPPALLQIDQMQQAAKMAPKNARAWINLGNTLMDAQRFSEAVDAYEKAVALDPKNVDVLVDLGTCYRGIGKFDKAMELYRRGIKINPNHLNAHRNSGVVLAFDLNDKKEAVKAFEKYLGLAPAAPDAAQIRQTIQELKAGSPAGK